MYSHVPAGHPISIEDATKLLQGPIADLCREILKNCCAPIYWFDRNDPKRKILNNGTVTFVQTSDVLIGITAAHVIDGLKNDLGTGDIQIQIMNAVVNDLLKKIISYSSKFDLVTFLIDENITRQLGKSFQPLNQWPPIPPQEGRGIMLAGYPGVERNAKQMDVEFGLFTALVSARTVTDTQITWLIDPTTQITDTKILSSPPKYSMGGISGGPLLTCIESEQHIFTYVIGGIITEHPDYSNNEFSIDRLIAVRADLIMNTGRIHM